MCGTELPYCICYINIKCSHLLDTGGQLNLNGSFPNDAFCDLTVSTGGKWMAEK